MNGRDFAGLAAIVKQNMAAARSADKFREYADGDCHRALVRQVAYDVSRFCASRSERFCEADFLEACDLIQV